MNSYRDLQQRSGAVPDARTFREGDYLIHQVREKDRFSEVVQFAPRNEINRKDLPTLRREFMDKLVRTPTGGWAWKEVNNKMQYSQSSIELVNAVFEFLGEQDE